MYICICSRNFCHASLPTPANPAASENTSLDYLHYPKEGSVIKNQTFTVLSISEDTVISDVANFFMAI
ncbi:hypothetical protein ACFFWB_07690 [Flavobacterium procerum]|uniref:hypothetical protein n=1 Tax=Flavobacterium procerum TaxID=1455569 RepID=UPI0035F0D139